MNYRNITIILLVLSNLLSFSQDKFSYGITAGFNYNSNGEYVTKGELADITNQFESEKKTGYHAGLYLQYKANSMYLRPEIVYTKTKSSYVNSDGNFDFDQTKIDIPVLVGFDIVKPLSIFVGPSFQYVIANELEDIDVENIDIERDLGINFQAGVALQIYDTIFASIRYEKGISNNALTIKDDVDTVIGELDTKPEQIILTISLKL